MVSARRRARPGSRLGSSTLGCVVSLALFVVAVYYGIQIGKVYLRYYQLLDTMRTQAELAPSLDDGVIERRLVARADSLFEGRPPRFRIRRGGTRAWWRWRSALDRSLLAVYGACHRRLD